MDHQRYLSNRELDGENVPPPDAELAEIGKFADSFDLVTHPRVSDFTGPAGQELLGRCFKDYQDRKSLPESLSELRACLALEWAILPYIAPYGPNPHQEEFIRAVVGKIRALVLAVRVD